MSYLNIKLQLAYAEMGILSGLGMELSDKHLPSMREVLGWIFSTARKKKGIFHCTLWLGRLCLTHSSS
jgi:hypothetical protein